MRWDRRLMMFAAGMSLALGAALSGCVVDGLVARALEDDPPDMPPSLEDATLEVTLPRDWEGATAYLHSPAGNRLDYRAVVGPDGVATFSLPGGQDFVDTVVYVAQGQKVLLGIMPPVYRAETVYDEPRRITSDQTMGFGGPMNELTTARVLLLMEAARGRGGLQAMHPRLLSETLLGLGSPDGRTDEIQKWEADFTRLFAMAEAQGDGPPLIDPEDLTLDRAFLAGVDLGERYLDDLAAAAATVRFKSCFSPDTIRLVLVVEMKDGMKDGACRPIDRFAHAKDDAPGKSMFVTGAVHEKYEGLTQEEREEIDALLGNWAPNRVAMYDDGTHGDAVAGDSIWTLALDMPRLDPPLRIGYKYSWGLPGNGWTRTEEWPGNRRILELVDVDGDSMIVRYDKFADEASNKDKVNLNPAAHGSLDWDEDLDGDGYPEAWEAPADLDGDCRPDGFPEVSVGPVLGDPDVEGGCFDEGR